MVLQSIEKRENLTPKEFKYEYLIPNKPVVFKDLVKDWPATNKWTFNWFKEKYGHLIVPLCDDTFHQSGAGYMAFNKHMPLGEYLDIIQSGPTDLRMFAYDIFKEVPELRNDFSMPKIMNGWHPNFSYMFFGGEGSTVNLHYDIDYGETFLTQFQTRKRIMIFGRENSRFLYQQPFTVKSLVNLKHPDYDKYPALRLAKGYETILEHGETIYIPHHNWHFIEYIDGGFGMNVRAHSSMWNQVKGLGIIARHFAFDKTLNSVLGNRWSHWKDKKAVSNANAAMTHFAIE